MTWALGNLAAANEVQNVNTIACAYPTVSAGHSIFYALQGGPTGQTFTVPGFTEVVTRTTNLSTSLFWKIADGTESGTLTATRSSSSGQLYGQMCSFTGGPATTAGNVHASSTAGGSASTGLNYAGLTITAPGCLVIVLGGKTGNCSGFAVPSGFDAEIAENHTANGLCMVWDYKIQTTAANITAGNWSITTDVSTGRNSVIAAFLPPSAGGPPIGSLMLLGVGR